MIVIHIAIIVGIVFLGIGLAVNGRRVKEIIIRLNGKKK